MSERAQELLAFARTVKGFMPDDEGLALYEAAREAGRDSVAGGAFVEIGAWCGKSTVYLGAACEGTSSVLFSIDHHHGSEENQSGWEHHDLEVVNPDTGRIDTLPFWRQAIDTAGLAHCVIGVVGDSANRRRPLGGSDRLLLHRRRARNRTRLGRLLRLGPEDRPRRDPRDPRRLSRSRRRRQASIRALVRRPRIRRLRRGRRHRITQASPKDGLTFLTCRVDN